MKSPNRKKNAKLKKVKQFAFKFFMSTFEMMRMIRRRNAMVRTRNNSLKSTLLFEFKNNSLKKNDQIKALSELTYVILVFRHGQIGNTTKQPTPIEPNRMSHIDMHTSS